ncbi:MAG: choice-of-anchor V domain-containing protein [Candidatus Binatia bacterium]
MQVTTARFAPAAIAGVHLFTTPQFARTAVAGLLAAAFVLATAPFALAASAGPQPASTGAPALGAEAPEANCTSCHTSFPLNPDTDGAVTIDGVPERYEPGRAYTLTVRVSHKDSAAMRWGFQLTAVAMKDGAGAGEFIATDTTTTLVLSAMSGTRSYVQHAYGGTAIGQPGGNAWTFEWKAPANDVGKIGFFAAGNVSNADGSNQGDRVYSPSPLPIAESIGTP